jgi:hypothetical protein
MLKEVVDAFLAPQEGHAIVMALIGDIRLLALSNQKAFGREVLEATFEGDDDTQQLLLESEMVSRLQRYATCTFGVTPPVGTAPPVPLPQQRTPGRATGGGALGGGATPGAGVAGDASAAAAAPAPAVAAVALPSQDAIKSSEADLADKDKKFYSVEKFVQPPRRRMWWFRVPASGAIGAPSPVATRPVCAPVCASHAVPRRSAGGAATTAGGKSPAWMSPQFRLQRRPSRARSLQLVPRPRLLQPLQLHLHLRQFPWRVAAEPAPAVGSVRAEFVTAGRCSSGSAVRRRIRVTCYAPWIRRPRSSSSGSPRTARRRKRTRTSRASAPPGPSVPAPPHLPPSPVLRHPSRRLFRSRVGALPRTWPRRVAAVSARWWTQRWPSNGLGTTPSRPPARSEKRSSRRHLSCSFHRRWSATDACDRPTRRQQRRERPGGRKNRSRSVQHLGPSSQSHP